MTTVDASSTVGWRLLAGPTDGRLDTHLGRHGRPPAFDAPRLGDLIEAAGGPAGALQAVLHGGWVPARPEIEIRRAALASYGASPGAGIVVALPMGMCGLAESARIAGYLAGQSAGQCGPCLNGLPRLAETLDDLARMRARPGLPAEVERLAGLAAGPGACRHPDGTVRLVRSAMRAFAADVTAHLAGRCLAVDSGHERGVRR
jgi:NADH:ubiquinone oxidoreductase subunit F (NADH-binding)